MSISNPKKIILASKNEHKIAEIKSIIRDEKISLLTLNEFQEGITIEETGKDFLENAIIKARAVYEKFNLPTISDDSGLVVPALNGEPGVYSARYAHASASDWENNLKLINKMKKLSLKETEAHFETAMVFYAPQKSLVLKANGIIKGKVLTTPRGENGFGYDPIFIPQNHHLTFAQMSEREKNEISHRRAAINDLMKKLNFSLLVSQN